MAQRFRRGFTAAEKTGRADLSNEFRRQMQPPLLALTQIKFVQKLGWIKV
jgi:hypothetical protein